MCGALLFGYYVFQWFFLVLFSFDYLITLCYNIIIVDNQVSKVETLRLS